MTAKEYLQQYLDLKHYIQLKNDELIELRCMAEKITPALKDVVVQCGASDKVGSVVAKFLDERGKLIAEIERYHEIRRNIEYTLKQLPDRYRVLLEMKYIQGASFERIAVEMNYSYVHVCRLHGSALLAVKHVMECYTEPC